MRPLGTEIRAEDAALIGAARAFLAWAQEQRLLQRGSVPPPTVAERRLSEVSLAYGAAADTFRTKPITAVGVNRVRGRIVVYTARTLTRAERSRLPEALVEGQGVEFAVAPPPSVTPAASLASEPRLLAGGLYACGHSIGIGNKRDAGTLGCLVQDADGELYGLSNHHVIADCGQALPGTPILAPGVLDVAAGTLPPFTIGFHARVPPIIVGSPALVDVTGNVDAALFRVAEPARVSSWQGSHHDTPGEVLAPFEEMAVQKVGRTTGLTEGVVESYIFDPVPVVYDIKVHFSAVEEETFRATIHYAGLFLVRGSGGPFAQPGDSGALVTAVVAEGRRAAVGLVLGGTGADTCYIMPLAPILRTFGVELVTNHGSPA
jgi:hypothetical protein